MYEVLASGIDIGLWNKVGGGGGGERLRYLKDQFVFVIRAM